ncbi:hypothetical protein [Lactobacillus crispatus]|uniref:Uncharacterized protein n=1 Tax=Lactobacillus crispatus TaxID=47770 RepID=A0AB37DJR0_9LACO|nr:hypothetical protein [Lactobacillus crispatus]QHQ69077.1 hypothetical protein GSR61_10850 [Lactobacillus crispatus]
MTTIKEFEKAMYSLNIDEVDKKIAEAKTSEEANFWADILDQIMQHNQRKAIDQKFKL